MVALTSQPVLPTPATVLIAAGLVASAAFILFFIWKRAKGSRLTAPSKSAQAKLSETAPKAEPKVRATLLFGTQTGTAERFSKQLKAELQQRYGDETAYDVLDMEEYNFEERLPKERLVFLLLATYGDGEPTDNAAEFFNWATKAGIEVDRGMGEKLLQGVSFGVFGLGNKQYEHFCAVGKRVHKAMLSLGAQPVVSRGDGDDDEDIEADFDKWRAELYTSLDASDVVIKSKAFSNVTQVIAADSMGAYEVDILSGDAASAAASSVTWSGDGTSVRSPFLATVTAVRELHTKDSGRSCQCVELNFSGSQAEYEAGDHVGVLAENGPEVVERAAAVLGLSPDLVFNLRLPQGNPHQLASPFKGPMSLRAALAWYTDLLGPISKPQLQAFAAFADGESGRKLLHLLSPEGHEDYRAWQCQSRSLLEVLEEFDDVKPPLGAFFGSIASRLQVRFYSISSSPKQHPRSVHVTCSLVVETTATGRKHRGVVSHQLQRSRPGDVVPAFIRRSTFKLPADPTKPVIMIGPGTGLAPFRGFLQERAALLASGAQLGPAHLFFGCRNRTHDYIYANELQQHQAAGALSRLYCAFSREGPQKEYVQHHLQQHAAEVWPLISAQDGHVYVCGEAKNMAKDVHRTLIAIAESKEGGGEDVIARLSESGRYQKDVW